MRSCKAKKKKTSVLTAPSVEIQVGHLALHQRFFSFAHSHVRAEALSAWGLSRFHTVDDVGLRERTYKQYQTVSNPNRRKE